jgi:hypothetical protein
LINTKKKKGKKTDQALLSQQDINKHEHCTKRTECSRGTALLHKKKERERWKFIYKFIEVGNKK